MKLLLANPDDVVFLGRVSTPTNYDGKAGMRYTLMLQGSVDAGSIVCSPEAFAMAENIEPFSKVNFVGDYSSDYKSLKITAIKAVR